MLTDKTGMWYVLARTIVLGYLHSLVDTSRERRTYHICYWLAVAIMFGSLMFALVNLIAVLIVISALVLMVLSTVIVLCVPAR